MRTTLTAVEITTSERVDVLLDLDPSDPVSALEAALAQLLRPTLPGLWLGDRALAPSDTIHASGVTPACVIGLGGPLPHRQPTAAARAELHVVSGPDAGVILPLPDGNSVITKASRPLTLSADEVDQPGLHLHNSPAGIVATDPDPGPRVLRAGLPLQGPTPLGAADLLAIDANLLALVATGPPDAAVVPAEDLTMELNRPPRLRPSTAAITVTLPSAPTEPEPRRLALLPLALPLVLGIVMTAVVGNPLFLLFTLMSPVLALGTWWSDRRITRRSGVRAAAAYAAAVAAAEADIVRLTAEETAARRAASPDAAALLRTATGPGRRLWERRRGDDDSLLLRVGTGPSGPELLRVTGDPSPPQPELLDLPITIPLREVGVLGLAGPSDRARALGRWLVGQAAVLHSPRDLSVLLLVDPAAPSSEPDWGWLRWLPHAQPSAGQDCSALVGATVDAVIARVADLTELVTSRTAAARDVRAQLTARQQPDVLVVLDGARALRSLPGMAAVLRDGPGVGVHVICLAEQERLLPEECLAVISVDGPSQLTVRRAGEAPRTGVRADLVSADWADQVARGLAPLRDTAREDGEGQLPSSARLLDVLGADPPMSAALLARWGRTTKAVVGRDVDGAFSLDLLRDGPHALVAGTTGAGKSELLQTLVASLAVANRPDAMTFVLVDYKGGAAFKDCARLPHTVGMVTDLDGHLVERALSSLNAELKTREQLLALAGSKDIEDYWEAGAPHGALARLVIVIDEFASLVEELPAFVRGLVGIAQRGRSLGVHLVLATQRPSGVISPEIRANTTLRIALRVTDAAESLDVLDAPDASTIAKSTPGRAYARTGHGVLSAFQTARVGGRTPGVAIAEGRPVDAVALPWSRVGDPVPPRRVEAEPDQDQTDLYALVEALRAAAAELGLPPGRAPWLDPLPAAVTLDEVRRLAPATGSAGLPHVVFGLEDLPEEQTRRAAVLDLEHGGHLLVAGAPRSGRSTLLRTLAASLAATIVPADAHLYVLDCGNGALLPLADLPHCGAVVSRTQVERAERLLGRLAGEVARRQELLADRGFADVAEQRAASADPLPYLVLFLDRWEGFTSAFEEIDAGRLVDTFLRLLREGPGAGLRVVVTGDRSALLGRISSAIEDRLVLRLADRSDYSLAGLSPRALPDEIATGRGFRTESGREVQIALLAADPSGQAQAVVVSELAAVLPPAKGRKPFSVDVLPARITWLEARALGPAATGVAVGVGGDDLRLQTVDLRVDGPGFTIAGPPRSGRSLALLGMAESLLTSGTALCVLAPRPSPLRDLVGVHGVLAVETTSRPDPTAVAEALNAAPGPVAVLVDDAELLHDCDVGALLQQVVRSGRDTGHSLVLAGTSDELASSFRGFTFDARKSRSGLLLSPESHLHGELLGVRLPRSAAFTGPAGRGLLVRAGQVVLVQVPVSAEPR